MVYIRPGLGDGESWQVVGKDARLVLQHRYPTENPAVSRFKKTKSKLRVGSAVDRPNDMRLYTGLMTMMMII